MVFLVLDLDETLIHTMQITQAFSKRLNNATDFHFKINNQYYWVRKRPGIDLFLDFAFKHFTVGIWTAAEKDYAKEICRKILSMPQLHATKFIYSRNFCHLDSTNMPPMFVKPLAKIWAVYPEMNRMNTLMIDNNLNVMKYNPHNGIHIPDFIGQTTDKFLYKIRNLMINYYKKVPMHLPVWGIANHINGEL
tara:strand:- start:19363 stop:19938 length:576 start_codon:yes stop_codon:yes gene_type:complete